MFLEKISFLFINLWVWYVKLINIPSFLYILYIVIDRNKTKGSCFTPIPVCPIKIIICQCLIYTSTCLSYKNNSISMTGVSAAKLIKQILTYSDKDTSRLVNPNWKNLSTPNYANLVHQVSFYEICMQLLQI